jgi:hypothetical protein
LLLTPAVKNFVSNLAIVMGGILVLTITLSGVWRSVFRCRRAASKKRRDSWRAAIFRREYSCTSAFLGRGDEMDR